MPKQNSPAGAQSSDDLQSLFAAAVAAHQRGNYQEAESLYQQLIAILPDNVNLICNLGLLYRDMGKSTQAMQTLEKAQQLDPDNFSVNLNIGTMYEAQGELDKAVAAYQKAQKTAPHDPRVMNNLGKALYQQGDRQAALEHLQQAVAQAPEYAMAQNNLGVLLSSLGEFEKAISCFQKALEMEATDCATLYNLAGSLSITGKTKEAEECYQKILAIEPDNDPARHMLAALTGKTSSKAPTAYVVDTFDRYAGHFDNQLTENLQYNVPTLLREAVIETLGKGPFTHCLDLGCGTGLSGLAFRDLATKLSGVDLSPGMLARAREKAIYDKLYQDDVVGFLDTTKESYDLFIATDVFIYIGDVAPTFETVRKCAADTSYLAFSVETTKKESDYVLRPSGRYAQSDAYIARLADQYSYDILESRQCNIRKEQGEWIDGRIFILAIDK